MNFLIRYFTEKNISRKIVKRDDVQLKLDVNERLRLMNGLISQEMNERLNANDKELMKRRKLL